MKSRPQCNIYRNLCQVLIFIKWAPIMEEEGTLVHIWTERGERVQHKMLHQCCISPPFKAKTKRRGATDLSFHGRQPCCARNAELAKSENIQNQLYRFTKSPGPQRMSFWDYNGYFSQYSKPCDVIRQPTNTWITAVDRGWGGGNSSPRRLRERERIEISFKVKAYWLKPLFLFIWKRSGFQFHLG